MKDLSHNKDLGLLIMRVIIGAIFLIHGYLKLTDMAGTIGFFSHVGLPVLLAYVVTAIEFFGGISLILGYGSKIASLLLALEMFGAMFSLHAGNGFNVSTGGYEYALTMFAVTFGLYLIGPGAYGLGSECGCPTKDGTCAVK